MKQSLRAVAVSLGLIVLFLGSVFQVAAQAQVAAGATEFMVEMRDGIKLATNVFLPEGDGPWPAVVTRTPYGKDGRFGSGTDRWTDAGFAYVVQDCRGKFRSEGEYRPFQPAREDGYDTIEWIAGQPWSNGKVGITGPSAMGITGSLAASADPPHLDAAYVVVTPSTRFNQSTFINGVFKEADVGNWMRGQGAGDQVAGTKARVIMDEQWKRTDLINHIQKIDVPIFSVGGWYDIFSQGNLDIFMYLQHKGREGARGNQKLSMGPFGHGQLRGDLEYPDGGGLRSSADDELRWFNYWLKGIDDGLMDEPPVRYYMMASARKGAASAGNEWRTAPDWPPESREVRYFLNGSSSLTTRRPTGADSSTGYDFDPSDPVPTVGGANLTLPLGPMDQREIGERQDYLRFQTAPLEQAVSIAGHLWVELWASTDGPDTDFMVKLVDVYPDGYEALVLDAPFRTRYRRGRNAQDVKMMTPSLSSINERVQAIIGEILGVEEEKITEEASFAEDLGADSLDLVEMILTIEEEFGIVIPDEDAEKINEVADVIQSIHALLISKPVRLWVNLWSTAITFEAGHRIALHISSSNSPRFEVNPNTGEDPGQEGKGPRVARNTIYHDAARPSAIILPVLSD